MVISNSYVKLPEGIWLVVYLPLWKIYIFVNGKDDNIPYMMEK